MSGLKEPEVKESFSSGTMMIGCHKTKDSSSPRQFSGGIFDEVSCHSAVTKRHL